MGFYSKAKEAADHIVTWAGFFVLLAGSLTWLSSHLTILKGANWADFIFVGIIAASVVMLALAAALAAWRHFRPLPVFGSLAPYDEEGDEYGIRDMSETERRFAQSVEALRNQTGGEYAATTKWINDLHQAAQALTSRVVAIDQRTQFPANMGATIGEAFAEFQRATRAQMDSFIGQTKTLTEPYRGIPFEVLHLLNFAIFVSTRTQIESFLAWGPDAPTRDSDLTEENIAAYEAFILKLRSVYARTNRGDEISMVLETAKNFAEHALRGIPKADWPEDVTPVDYTYRKILEKQVVDLRTYLKHQIAHLDREIAGMRATLIDCENARTKKKA